LLGRDGEIKGRNVCVFINQLYSGHEKYILLEVEVGAVTAKETRKIASVNVRYDNLQTHDSDKLSAELSATFSSSKQLVDKKTNHKVMVDVVEQIATERNELAVTLRDQGQIDKAREVLGDNVSYLNLNAARYNSKKLKDFGMLNDADAMNLDEQNWTRQRKSMRYQQSSRKRQQ
jgi:Ca-activated chloride channel family protein